MLHKCKPHACFAHMLLMLLNELSVDILQFINFVIYGSIYLLCYKLSYQPYNLYSIKVTMGLLKIFAILIVPVSAMTYAAASLGKQLPKASRWFGNYIGLNYVYFKSILKVLKPQDEIPYQMIDLARKASQQSEALRRQLRNTVKKAKQQLDRKNQQIQTKFDQKLKQSKGQVVSNLQSGESTQNWVSTKKNQNQFEKEQEQTQQQAVTGSQIMRDLQKIREQLQTKKRLKKQSKKFYEQI